MARMIPDRPAHQSSEAELRLFNELKRLPAGFVVLHSLGLTRHDHKRWSEIDFLVICPDGVFLLEVKGGVIERTDGEWFVTDRTNKKESLGRGPFAQVGGAEAATRRFLRDRIPEMKSATMGYAVVAPDCVLDLDGLDVDRAICFDASNMSLGIGSLLSSLAMHWRNRIPAQAAGLDNETIARVADALCADIPGVASIKQRIAGTLAEIDVATREQELLLAELHFRDRVVVNGPAGSGKSTIAFNECLLRAAAGQKVLYLCHTPSFAEYLKVAAGGDPNMHVVSVDNLSGHLDTHGAADALVIDEGQDTLRGLSPNDLDRAVIGGVRGGKWRLLLDPFQLLDEGDNEENQRLFEQAADVIRSLELNVRGTVEIAVTSSAFGYVDRVSGGIHGPEVSLRFSDPPVLWDDVLAVVDGWVDKGISPADLLVLVAAETLRDAELDPDPGFSALRSGLARRGVILSTPNEMKGRESAGVVYAGARGLKSVQERREAYLACSRAQVLLVVAGCTTLEADVGTAYAAAVMRATAHNQT